MDTAAAAREQRGAALPQLESLSLCEMGWAMKSHLCLTLTRPSSLSAPEPTEAEMELSMTCARGEPASPELIVSFAAAALVTRE